MNQLDQARLLDAMTTLLRVYTHLTELTIEEKSHVRKAVYGAYEALRQVEQRYFLDERALRADDLIRVATLSDLHDAADKLFDWADGYKCSTT